MTPGDILTDVRNRLDEPTPAQWSDSQLLTWLNEGLRDAARHTRHLRDTRTISVVANALDIAVQTEVIEVERAYWITSDDRQIPLDAISRGVADDQWGEWQNSMVGVPHAFSLWGVPPELTMRLYPRPETAGTLSLLVVRMPTEVRTDGADNATTLDWPPAWSDLLVDYVEMCALRKDRDPRWREAFEFYTAKRDGLDTNGSYSDMPEFFEFDARAGMVPRWITDPGW